MKGKRTDRIGLPRQLRLDPELSRALHLLAEANRRSIGQEILHLLERALKSDEVNCGQFQSQRKRLMRKDFLSEEKSA